MKVREVMTSSVRTVSRETSVIDAAKLMRLLGTGVLPVLDRERFVGVLTDRDIVLQVVANGANPMTATVGQVMSLGSVCIDEDQDIAEASGLMQQHQIRRLPVVSRDSKLIGVVALRDISDPTETLDARSGVSTDPV
jgi:CBS domain-containing protein